MLCFGLDAKPADFDSAEAFGEALSAEAAALVCRVRDVRAALDEGRPVEGLGEEMLSGIRALDMARLKVSLSAADDGSPVLVLD